MGKAGADGQSNSLRFPVPMAETIIDDTRLDRAIGGLSHENQREILTCQEPYEISSNVCRAYRRSLADWPKPIYS
jgi:hypothetical protein